MKMLVSKWKITLAVFMIMVLICGLSSLSYGQEDDALTISNVTCEASNIDTLIGRADVTVKGTILANRAVTDVTGWITINGTVMSGGGFPAIFDPFTKSYFGGVSFGDFSEGQTKSFSITSIGVFVNNNTTCGYYFEFISVDTPPQTESEVLVVDPDSPPIYWTVADKIKSVNLDGSNVEDLVTGLDDPIDIALDVSDSKMYWVDNGARTIQRANLDGSNVEDLGWGATSSIALDVADGKMYWTTRTSASSIRRANLDGSNIEDLITQELNDPYGIALDVSGGKMYWTDTGTGKIQRANLDGSNTEDLITQGLNDPNGIALDVSGGKMYWTDAGTEKIQRANLDGSNIEDLVTQNLLTPVGIALDVSGGKMYWTDATADKIQRANLDGSNVEDVVTGLDRPFAIALATPPQITPPTPDPVTVSENTILRIHPASIESPEVGEELTINLNITDAEAILGYQINVQYDTTALRYVSAANGDFLPDGAYFVDPVVEGNLITLNAASTIGAAKGDGTLATIIFEVIEVKESTLTLSDVLLAESADEGIMPQLENAVITKPIRLKEDVNSDGSSTYWTSLLSQAHSVKPENMWKISTVMVSSTYWTSLLSQAHSEIRPLHLL